MKVESAPGETKTLDFIFILNKILRVSVGLFVLLFSVALKATFDSWGKKSSVSVNFQQAHLNNEYMLVTYRNFHFPILFKKINP